MHRPSSVVDWWIFCWILQLIFVIAIASSSEINIVLKSRSEEKATTQCNLNKIYVLEFAETIQLKQIVFPDREEWNSSTAAAAEATELSCLYQHNHDNSSHTVALTVNRNSISGIVAIHNKTYFTVNFPLNSSSITFTEDNSLIGRNGTCGVDLGKPIDAGIKKPLLNLDYVNFTIRNYFVELYLIADFAFYQKHGSDSMNYLYQVLNYLNAVYRGQGIHILPVKIDLWSSGNKLAVTSNSSVLLDNLRFYRSTLTQNHDNLHMINGFSYLSNVLGLAFTHGMCSYSYSEGITSDTSTSPIATAMTMAHEIGHNLGLNHDTSGCTCSPDSTCIMNAYSSGGQNPLKWSTCSLSDMHKYLQSGSSSYCLKNLPDSASTSGSCGNGIIDSNEDCDPGVLDTSSSCCNTNTCKFTSGASCASGSCCDKNSCTFIPSGVACRTAYDECDLNEYCSGSSEICPNDFYKYDGILCDSNRGSCYKGLCGSHNRQCQMLYGSSSSSAADLCYSQLNTGTPSFGTGYCSYSLQDAMSGSYILSSCNLQDAKCGELFCQGPNTPQWPSISAYYAPTLSGNQCFHVFQNVNLTGLRDPGLVPNGAICDTNKICVDSTCVSQTVIPGGTCTCSNQGVCNNQGHCHCNYGYNGNQCQNNYGGCGGSVDSGPACDKVYVMTTKATPNVVSIGSEKMIKSSLEFLIVASFVHFIF